jgi:hypothetical protein
VPTSDRAGSAHRWRRYSVRNLEGTRVTVQLKTVTQASSEDLTKAVVESEFDDWAGGAKTALIVVDSTGLVSEKCNGN